MPREPFVPAPLMLRPGFVSPWVLLSLVVALAGVSAPASAERCVVAEVPPGVPQFPCTCELGFRSMPRALLVDFGTSTDYLECQWLDRNFQVISTSLVPGGKIDEFKCILELAVRGVGAYSGYSRVVVLPATGKMFSANQTPGVWSQDFAIEMRELVATLPPGDPDFDLLRITAGTGFGMPGPGRAAGIKLPPGQWAMDVFFDLSYRIDFVGASSGPFAGTSASTPSETRLVLGEQPRRTHGVPDAAGTAEFPPSTALTLTGYTTPVPIPLLEDPALETGHAHGYLDLGSFQSFYDMVGGDYGGNVQGFGARLKLDLFGTGIFAGYHRQVEVPVTGKTQTGPRAPGLPVQAFPCELLDLQGSISGDPDFNLLRITVGTSWGLPSPGHTTLTQLPGGNWSVDSFFDITYRIDFVGAPSGVFAGHSGTVTDHTPVLMGSRELDPCVAPDIGGTARFPAACPGGYESPPASFVALNGVPPGSPILADIKPRLMVVVDSPGGPLGGSTQSWSGDCEFRMYGLGALAGFSRLLSVPISGHSASAPRGGGVSPQSFVTDLTALQGQITGDPDFDLLRITAGTGVGMPCPGHTVFTRTVSGDWTVDSFFDITYRIDFVGAAGGALAGMSGSTAAVNRFHAGVLQNVDVGRSAPARRLELRPAIPNPSAGPSAVELRLPGRVQVEAAVYDVAGRRVAPLVRQRMEAGSHSLRWDGRDARGTAVRSGLYFYRVRAGDQVLTRGVVLQH